MSKSERVILIGLDGLGFKEIEPWISEGSLPTLESVGNEGSTTDLSSTHPPWTPCAWPSMLTGRNPGTHGVFDFFTSDGYDKQLITRSDVDSPYLSEVADYINKTPLLINYPVTHPNTKLDNGAIIPGYLANENVNFYPENIRADYEKQYGTYSIYPTYGTKENPVSEYVDVARCRRDMARFLDARYDWDLMAVQFQVTDSIFHDLDDRGQIGQVLKQIDSFVGDIIDLGDDNASVFIVSDHGMGDYEWTFYINSWLAEHGYCETTEGDAMYFRQQKSKLKAKAETKSKANSVGIAVKGLSRAFSQIGFSPQRIHRGLSRFGLAATVERLLPEEALVAAQNQVVDHGELNSLSNCISTALESTSTSKDVNLRELYRRIGVQRNTRGAHSQTSKIRKTQREPRIRRSETTRSMYTTGNTSRVHLISSLCHVTTNMMLVAQFWTHSVGIHTRTTNLRESSSRTNP